MTTLDKSIATLAQRMIPKAHGLAALVQTLVTVDIAGAPAQVETITNLPPLRILVAETSKSLGHASVTHNKVGLSGSIRHLLVLDLEQRLTQIVEDTLLRYPLGHATTPTLWTPGPEVVRIQ
jgi:hypothetical protein